MNIYKKRNIVDSIREQGSLPTDQFGQVLSPDDLLVWFGLNECLTQAEQYIIKEELAAMVDTELAMDKLKHYKALQGGD
ncbi:MAG: hypothetical protein K8S56_05865 [Candidatus Cloacimonetes bacterium]|nr:hypothetical protein [Candidatus Cloacimonadota bacterium]